MFLSHWNSTYHRKDLACTRFVEGVLVNYSHLNVLHFLHCCHKVRYSTKAKRTLQNTSPSPFLACGLPHAQVAFSCWKDKDIFFFSSKSCVEKQKSADWASRRSTDVIPTRLTAKWTAECAERERMMVWCSDLSVILFILPLMKKNTHLKAMK